MPSSTADLEASAAGIIGSQRLPANVLALFQQLLSAEFVAAALQEAKVRENNRVYTSPVVMWLMVWQRLQVQGTLESAVLELLRGLPSSFWPQRCKRLAKAVGEGGTKLSNHTGAYNQARKGLSLPVVEQCCDHAFKQLIEAAEVASEAGRPAFFLDGTTVRMPHTEEPAQAYPPTSNQHGQSHWPLIRMLVAHDVYTGLAMRPEWGPVNGSQAVSEQSLLEQAIHRCRAERWCWEIPTSGCFRWPMWGISRVIPCCCASRRRAPDTWPREHGGMESISGWCGDPAGTTAKAIPNCPPRPA